MNIDKTTFKLQWLLNHMNIKVAIFLDRTRRYKVVRHFSSGKVIRKI